MQAGVGFHRLLRHPEHLQQRRPEGRLQVTDDYAPTTSSPTHHRQGLHHRGLHRQPRQHIAAAATTTTSTRLDTRPLTVLLQDATTPTTALTASDG